LFWRNLPLDITLYEGQEYNISEYVSTFNSDTYDNFSPYLDLIVCVNASYLKRVAKVKVTNLISWDFGGCLGQTIPLIDDGETKTVLGYSNQDILPDLKNLDISYIDITDGYSRDYEIEEAIRQKLFDEKNKSKQNQIDSFYNEYIKEANALLAQKEYEKAKSKFKQASDLKKNESYPAAKIAEIDRILDEQKKEIQFNKLVAEGDNFAASDKKTEARVAYREALRLKPGNTTVQTKLDALGKDPVEDYIVEIKKLVLNGRRDLSESEPEWKKATEYRNQVGTTVWCNYKHKKWFGEGSYEMQDISIVGNELRIKQTTYWNVYFKSLDNPVYKTTVNYYYQKTTEGSFNLSEIMDGSYDDFIRISEKKMNFSNARVKDGWEFINYPVEYETDSYKSNGIIIMLKDEKTIGKFYSLLKQAAIAAGAKLKN
jgi:hypothetical protein